MRILCIQHADFETPGTIEQWASNNGHSFKVEKPYRGEQLSEIGGFDLLISMGGPQSAVRIAEFPYLQPELALIRTAFSENRKILGILDRFAAVGMLASSKLQTIVWTWRMADGGWRMADGGWRMADGGG